MLHDLRYAFRMLFKNPAFTAAALLAVGLSIGTVTTIFSAVSAVLLRPLPYADPNGVMIIWARFEARGADDTWLSSPEVQDFREQATHFNGFAAMTDLTLNMTGAGEPEQLQIVGASQNLFPLLGVNMVEGRGFAPEEDQEGAGKAAVLSHGFWQRRFGGDRSIVGKALTLDGSPYTVVGVLPADFTIPPPSSVFPARVDLYVPFAGAVAKNVAQSRDARNVHVLARLKPGGTPEQAQAEMSTIAARLQQQYPEAYPANSGWRLTATPFHEYITRGSRLALLILLGAGIFVLLISCINVANLLLARAVAREKEFAVRLSLGASPWKVVRQLLTESLVLAFIGGLIGVALAYWGIGALVSLSPGDIPRLGETRIDGWTLAFTALVLVLTALLSGLAPAWQSRRIDVGKALKDSARASTSGGARGRLRAALMVGQVALVLVLLVGMGLLIKTFLRLQSERAGFAQENVLTLRLPLSQTSYPKPADRVSFVDRIIAQLAAAPGVQAAGAVSHLPMSGAVFGSRFEPVGESLRQGEPPLPADLRGVTPGYFKALGIPLLRGRTFEETDKADASPVAVIDETLAKRLWADGSAVGRRLKWIRSETPLEVVGVVGAIKHAGLAEPARETVYFPYAQYSRSTSMSFAVRASGDPIAQAGALRSRVWALDPNQPVSDVRPMQELVLQSIARQRLNMVLLGIFAVVALVLAVVGIYGMVSYVVAQRKREIGIRMALGATPNRIFRLILGQALWLTLAGVGLGLLLSIALTRLMASLLFGVESTDPLTFVSMTLLLTLIVVVASFFPARRAMRVSPAVSIVEE
jgi:putative ABC transport system permease protein